MGRKIDAELREKIVAEYLADPTIRHVEKIPKSCVPKKRKIAPRTAPITIIEPCEIQTIFLIRSVLPAPMFCEQNVSAPCEKPFIAV